MPFFNFDFLADAMVHTVSNFGVGVDAHLGDTGTFVCVGFQAEWGGTSIVLFVIKWRL